MESRPTGRPEHGRLAILAIPMVAFTISMYVGNALAPTLANEAPLVLLILSPKLRWLFLVSAHVETVPFFLVPLARASLVLGVYHALGRWYGDRSLRWLETRAGNALRPVLWVERRFHRSRVPVTFILPGPVSALLAGADGMHPALFFAVALGSITLRIWAVRALAQALRGPLLDVLTWVGDNQIWLTLASVTGVIVWVVWSNRRHVGPEETVGELLEDLEAQTSTPGSDPAG